MKSRKTQGFTLVEIMIVVVIIGLLAAMAIPAFNKVRQNSITKGVVNDARQLATAAQQYFLETGNNSVALTVNTETGRVEGDLLPFVKVLNNKATWPDSLSANAEFTVAHPQSDFYTVDDQQSVGTFEPEGQLVPQLP